MSRIKTKLDIIYNGNAKKDIVILHISDIHFNSNSNPRTLNRISRYINNIKADYVMITGDILDDPKIIDDDGKIRELVVFLTDIAKNSKVFISLGNHDIVYDKGYLFFNKLNDLYNIYVLNNLSYEDEYIYVAGFTIPTEYYYNINMCESVEVLLDYLNGQDKIINKLPSKKIKIALIHSPIRLTNRDVLKKLHEYDIILCGHTHGGMVPNILRFLFRNNYGLVGPTKKLFPVIAKGKIEDKIGSKGITIIINEAITKLSLKSGKSLSKLNVFWRISINKIVIMKRKRYLSK